MLKADPIMSSLAEPLADDRAHPGCASLAGATRRELASALAGQACRSAKSACAWRNFGIGFTTPAQIP